MEKIELLEFFVSFCVTSYFLTKYVHNIFILARSTGFEPVTLGLEIRGLVITNYSELHRFVYL